MANKPLDTNLLDRAIKFAVDAHAGTERRGKGFPYVVHPLEAVSIVATMTPDQELLAAAALHDTIEDTGVTLEQLRAEFGDRVANLVRDESDVFVEGLSEEASWRMRKQAAIDRIEAAPYEAKMVAMGDKLSNLRAIARDYKQVGDKLWKLFHAPGGKVDHEWHYRGLGKSLSALSGTDAYAEFCSLLDIVFGDIAPEQIDMSEYEESGDGYTAISYNHRDGKTMIKLYSDFVPKNEPLVEFKKNKSLETMGINIPAVKRLVTDGTRYGLEFERLQNKHSFARAICNNPEKLDEYATKFARECKKLHNTECRTDLFPNIKDVFRGYVKQLDLFTEEEKEKLYRFIDDTPDATTCVHGDLHFGNILEADGKIYWIDLADFAYGHPLFDLGMYFFISFFGEDELVEHLYHVNKQQIVRIWDVFAKEYFGADADQEAIIKLVKPYAAMPLIHFATRGLVVPELREILDTTIFSKHA